MEIRSLDVDLVESKALIKSRGTIKSGNVEADRTITHRGLGLQLTDQSSSDSSLAVLWEYRKVG
jgi:hypothetical protein